MQQAVQLTKVLIELTLFMKLIIFTGVNTSKPKHGHTGVASLNFVQIRNQLGEYLYLILFILYLFSWARCHTVGCVASGPFFMSDLYDTLLKYTF